MWPLLKVSDVSIPVTSEIGSSLGHPEVLELVVKIHSHKDTVAAFS